MIAGRCVSAQDAARRAMSPIGITLLMLAAFGGFFYLAWRKLAIVVSLAPEVRWDDPLARLQARWSRTGSCNRA